MDGVQVATGTGTAGTFNGLTDLVIGQNAPDNATRRFVGSLDEIRVYGSALSDSQIAALAVRGAPFQISAFSYNRVARTVNLTFSSDPCFNYTIETSPNGQTWTTLGAPVPGTAGATTTTVTGRPLPPPVLDRVLLRVRRAP